MPRGRTSRPRRRSHMPRFRPRAVREARRAARARACADRSEAALSTAPGPRVGERLRATRRQQPAKRPGLRRYRFVSIRVRTIRRRACAAFLSSRLLASFGQAWPHYLAPVIVKLEMQRSVTRCALGMRPAEGLGLGSFMRHAEKANSVPNHSGRPTRSVRCFAWRAVLAVRCWKGVGAGGT